MLDGIIGILVWMAANGLYMDMRRKGKRGFARFVLFWMGFPWTLLWRHTIPEGNEPVFVPVSEDVEGMIEMVRRERALLEEAEKSESGAL